MVAIPQAAIAASVIVGLVAVPAASQDVEITGAATAQLPNVSSSNEVPKEVSRTTSSEGFSATVETAFNRFSTSIDSGSANATLESPGAELEVQGDSGERRWVLTTPEGTLSLSESSEKTVEKVSTPNGDLRIVVEEGARTTEFSGGNRDKVEKTRQRLHNALERKRSELDRRRKNLEQRAMPDVEVIVNSSTASASPTPEHVVLVNREMEPVDLQGWQISDPASSYEFGSVELPPGERLHVYSEDDSEVDGKKPSVFETGIAWNDGGDVAVLKNANGHEIDRESY